jgi:hypothetical protein
MSNLSDLVWSGGAERITISPRQGGRIISWIQAGEERVHPLLHFEGGLFRILFAEEQYPGASYVTPHDILDWKPGPAGFRLRLRHYWNTPGWFMRAAGWPEKASELHIDDLLLEKLLTYDQERACLICDMTISNLGAETKYVTPWVHLSFTPWPSERWVAVNGERQEYRIADIYWGEHLVPPGAAAALVLADPARRFYGVLGAATDRVRGLCGMLPVKDEFHQASAELRGATVVLEPGAQYRANCYLAFTNDWQAVANQPPIPLYSAVTREAGGAKDIDLTGLLAHWMLPDERNRGLMILSFLDKPPFYTAARYAAAHCFAGFHALDGKAQARVMLYAPRAIAGLRAELAGGGEWLLGIERPRHGAPSLNDPTADAERKGRACGRTLQFDLPDEAFVALSLSGPADLAGKDDVVATVTAPGQPPVMLRIPSDARCEERYPYQVRQAPRYLELRYADKRGPAPAATAAEIRAWQRKMRARFRRWLEFNAAGPCELEPRCLERQVGPTCVREKWLIQTEPGIYIPGYLVRPRDMRGRRPLIFLLHGSGPGKDGYAGDETLQPVRTQLGHELEHMAYPLARLLKCQVYVPDGRGQGELGETDPGRWSVRMEALGLANVALRLFDQIRALDWLITRDDVDGAYIGSCGCSGGGGMTAFFAAADERISACIVSSTMAAHPLAPVQPGWFQRMLLESGAPLDPPGNWPIGGPPTGMLIAPRAQWIIDGYEDLGIPPEQRAEWRQSMQRGRDAIRGIYERFDAAERFVDTWFKGGHCAGMTSDNVAAWFRKWFAI